MSSNSTHLHIDLDSISMRWSTLWLCSYHWCNNGNRNCAHQCLSGVRIHEKTKTKVAVISNLTAIHVDLYKQEAVSLLNHNPVVSDHLSQQRHSHPSPASDHDQILYTAKRKQKSVKIVAKLRRSIYVILYPKCVLGAMSHLWENFCHPNAHKILTATTNDAFFPTLSLVDIFSEIFDGKGFPHKIYRVLKCA